MFIFANKMVYMMKIKHVQYETQGTCSRLIDVTADENDVIQQAFFVSNLLKFLIWKV